MGSAGSSKTLLRVESEAKVRQVLGVRVLTNNTSDYFAWRSHCPLFSTKVFPSASWFLHVGVSASSAGGTCLSGRFVVTLQSGCSAHSPLQ